MRVDLITTPSTGGEGDFGWPYIQDPVGVYPKMTFEVFDGATVPLNLTAYRLGNNTFKVEGEYTNRFWAGMRLPLFYLDDNDKEQQVVIVTTENATYSAGWTTVYCTNISDESGNLPDNLTTVRAWLDCPNWGAELQLVASHTMELQDHMPFLVFPLKTTTKCYSQMDAKVPASSIVTQFDSANEDRFVRKPLAPPLEEFRDNATDKRWKEGLQGSYNLDIRVDFGGRSFESDANDLIDYSGDLKFPLSADFNKFNLRRSFGKASIAVKEVGSNSLGHYIYIYKGEDLAVHQKYAIDKLPQGSSIFFIPFDTGDENNFYVTQGPDPNADRVDGSFIKGGKDYEIYVMPRRMVYELHTREFEVPPFSDLDSQHSLLIPVTCHFWCTGQIPAPVGPEQGNHACDSWGGASGAKLWGPLTPEVWWNIPDQNDSDCIDYIINLTRAGIMQSTSNPLILINTGGIPYQLEQYPGFGPYDAQTEQIDMPPFRFIIQNVDRSCFGCYCHAEWFWWYCAPCTALISDLPEYQVGGMNNACDNCTDITSVEHFLFKTIKSKQTHHVGIWYDRFPNELAVTDIVNTTSGLGLDMLIQDQTAEEIGANSGLNNFHLVSAIVDPSVEKDYFDVQSSDQNVSIGPYVKLTGAASPSAVTRLWQKIAGVVVDPNDPNNKIPTVGSSDFWNQHGPPSYNPDDTSDMRDNFPFGVGIAPTQAGELCGIIRRKNSDDVWFIWRATDEDLTPSVTSEVEGYEGHITSWESWNQGEEQNGDVRMFREDSVVYYDGNSGINLGLGVFVFDFVDQFTGTERRVKTAIGRELDDSWSTAKPKGYASCGNDLIFPYQNIDAGDPVKTKSVDMGSFVLPAPAIIMLSKRRTL